MTNNWGLTDPLVGVLWALFAYSVHVGIRWASDEARALRPIAFVVICALLRVLYDLPRLHSPNALGSFPWLEIASFVTSLVCLAWVDLKIRARRGLAARSLTEEKRPVFSGAASIAAASMTVLLVAAYTRPMFIHPETLNKYPRFLERPGALECLYVAFNPCLGEATAHCSRTPCASETKCESRSRNVAYAVDCLDARWTRWVRLSLPPAAPLVAMLLTFLLLYRAFTTLPGVPQSHAVSFSLFPLLSEAFLATNGVIYRSGKALACVYVALVFAMAIGRARLPLWRAALFLICSALLVLSDEWAVAVAVLGFCLHVSRILGPQRSPRDVLLVLCYLGTLAAYGVFRVVIEPALALALNGIHLVSGGYANVATFVQASWWHAGAVIVSLARHTVYFLGSYNYRGATWFGLGLASAVGAAATLRFTARVLVRDVALACVVVASLYLMALRHEPIVYPRGANGYYFAVPMLLLFLYVLVRLHARQPSILLRAMPVLLAIAAASNVMTHLLVRTEELGSMRSPEWVDTSRRLVDTIRDPHSPTAARSVTASDLYPDGQCELLDRYLPQGTVVPDVAGEGCKISP